MFISSSPAALPFTRVLIGSSTSCKVNSSDSKDLCSSVLYLEYCISIFGCLCFAMLDKYVGHLVCSYAVLKAWFGWIIRDFADVMPCL